MLSCYLLKSLPFPLIILSFLRIPLIALGFWCRFSVIYFFLSWDASWAQHGLVLLYRVLRFSLTCPIFIALLFCKLPCVLFLIPFSNSAWTIYKGQAGSMATGLTAVGRAHALAGMLVVHSIPPSGLPTPTDPPTTLIPFFTGSLKSQLHLRLTSASCHITTGLLKAWASPCHLPAQVHGERCFHRLSNIILGK